MIAYLHPLWQSIALVSALVTLRWGMSVRRSRLRKSMEPRGKARAWHIRFGALTLSLLASGHLLGVLTMLRVREQPAFGTWHAYAGTAALVLFCLAGYYGWRMKSVGRYRETARELHVFCVALALFLALSAVIMGFPLLP